MSTQERKSIDRKFKLFVSRHFETPAKCKDLKQIQFYIRELSIRIDELKKNFNYVPQDAYSMLAEYNKLQNQRVYSNFKTIYC